MLWSIAGTALVACSSSGGGSVLVATPSRQGGPLFAGKNPQTDTMLEGRTAAAQAWDVRTLNPEVEEVGPTPTPNMGEFLVAGTPDSITLGGELTITAVRAGDGNDDAHDAIPQIVVLLVISLGSSISFAVTDALRETRIIISAPARTSWNAIAEAIRTDAKVNQIITATSDSTATATISTDIALIDSLGTADSVTLADSGDTDRILASAINVGDGDAHANDAAPEITVASNIGTGGCTGTLQTDETRNNDGVVTAVIAFQREGYSAS